MSPLLLLTALCSLHISGATKIIGGHEAAPHSRPYMVSLQSNGRHFCGGALISRRWVLTAAHCMENIRLDTVRVVVGAHDFHHPDKFQQVLTIWHSFKHPDYNPRTSENDIDIIVLDKLVNITSAVQTINLPLRDSDVPPGSPCSVAGWGYVTDSGTLPRVLMEVDVNVINRTDCNRMWRNKIFDSMVCTAGLGWQRKGFCSGDSGGPLVCRNQVEGLVSFSGHLCGDPKTPDVYTRVSAYLPWIWNVMGRY